MQTISRHAILAAFSIFIGAAGRLRAGDTDCAGSESSLKKSDWIYPLPARDKPGLPPVEVIEKAGAFVLVDEVLYISDDRVYTLMAMVGNREAFDAFSNFSVSTDFDGFAEIKARSQTPGGKVIELGESDIHCNTTAFDYLGRSIGKSFSPKTYSFRIAGLEPGSVVHYQISIRYHGSGMVNKQGYTRRCDVNFMKGTKGYATGYSTGAMNQVGGDAIPDVEYSQDTMFCVTTDPLGDQYGNAFDIRAGAQAGLLGAENDASFRRNRYPAANINYVLSLPKGMQLETRSFPADARITVSEQPSTNSAVEKIVKIQTRRPATPLEPYAPDFLDRSPMAVTDVKAINGSSYARNWLRPRDWGEWVNRNTSDIMLNAKADSTALAALLKEAPLTGTPAPRVAADHLDRYLRDRIANSGGYEIRNGYGKYRPPDNVISQAKTASAIEKALTLISLLKAQGIAAALVFIRPASRLPIDRATPLRDWFSYNSYLVAAETPQGRVFYDPVHRVAAGSLPRSYQGGEGLLVKDRSTWEWVTLPLSTEQQNRVQADVTIAGIADSVKGSLVIRYSGTIADALRDRAAGLTPDQLNAMLLRQLVRLAADGVSFSNLTHENLLDPDAPLIVKADYLHAGGLRKLGEKQSLRMLPLRPGPTGGLFGADSREQDIDFHVPERMEVSVLLPAALGKTLALPQPVKLSGPGMEYQLLLKESPEGITLAREVSLHGRIAAAKYGDIRAFLHKLDEADAVELIIGK